MNLISYLNIIKFIFYVSIVSRITLQCKEINTILTLTLLFNRNCKKLRNNVFLNLESIIFVATMEMICATLHTHIIYMYIYIYIHIYIHIYIYIYIYKSESNIKANPCYHYWSRQAIRSYLIE